MAKPDSRKPFKLNLSLWREVADTVAGIADVIDELREEMNSRFDKVGGRLDTLDVGQSHLKDQINGLKADLSDTPSRREFQQLKSKVDRHHPAHD